MLKFRNTENMDEVAVTVSTETFFRIALLTLVLIVLVLAVKKAEHELLLIFSAFFLTIALNAPVFWISRHLPGKRKGSRSLATSISFLFVVIVLGGFIALVVPSLIKQTDNLIKAAPHLIQQFHSQNSPAGEFIRNHHLQHQLNTLSTQLSDRLKNLSGTAFSTAKHVGDSIFSLITILVLTFMMLVEGPRWIRFSKEIVPKRHHKVAARLTHDMYRVIRGYVNGQVLLAALASLVIMPAVLLLHINYAAGILVVIFICGLIPLIGHSLGAVIVTTVALFHSLTAALIILAYYLVYMFIEAYIIQPKIQANNTNMSPLLVFMSVVIGVSFGGLFGGLVAIPVAGCLRIVLLEYLRSEKIIDTPKFDQVTTLDTK
jgi:predicted PurR-regulated permease PerM